MKKFTATFLSILFVITFSTSAFASGESRTYFMRALKITADEFAKETALVNKVDKSSALLKKLYAENPFECVVEAGFSSDHEELAAYSGLSAKLDAKYDLFESKYLMQIVASVPKALLGSAKNFDLDMTVYSDGNQGAISLPEVSDKFYSIAQTTSVNKWNEAPIGQVMPMDEESLELIKYYLSEYTINYMEMITTYMNSDNASDLNAPYTAILSSFFKKGVYKSEGTGSVETPRGLIGTKKTSVTFSQDQLYELIDSLIEQLIIDENLAAYLNSIYGGLNAATGMDMSSMYMETIISLLESIEMPEWLSYTIYTNSADKIIRHEIMAPAGDGGLASLTLDTLGQPYLLDDILITYKLQNGDDASMIKLSATGNYVPVNGVFKSNVTLKAVQETKGTEYPDVMELMRANYTLDINKTEDNLQLNIGIGRFGGGYTIDRTNDINIKINGDYAVNTANKSVTMNFKSINLKYDEYEMDMYLNVSYAAVDSSDVGVPEDELINLIDLTEEELEDMQKELTKLFKYFN